MRHALLLSYRNGCRRTEATTARLWASHYGSSTRDCLPEATAAGRPAAAAVAPAAAQPVEPGSRQQAAMLPTVSCYER
jgi:hypothetical protein